ncbi:LysM peptidoglycan-binding domain-containing protein [Streptococcus ovuberis]|uniref:LysM peptidoglycan-binding domain-containing protein n=1 Tax=Streptococcus ovuberis TaxID=1936207 RepID=A0A7X6S1W4_9STRE|nr:LysM peptidoglycan-binding domain-containing protein [Streptococcus ovuberis]NKZ20596.1 LysM peptidoglycan-binding domain-containing protein [Streptococcus ovuberis]
MHFFRKLSLGLTVLSLLILTVPHSVQAQENNTTNANLKTPYTVQIGDTLTQIAQQNNRDLDYLKRLNDIDDQNHLAIGQVIDLGDGETLADGEIYVRLYPAYIAGLAGFKYVAPAVPVQAATSATVNTVATHVVTQTAHVPNQLPTSTGVALANGNTAGEAGSYAAKKMEAATGVPAATWEHIIARESNGQVDAYNSSGASGLFQTMPGWGSTATVDDQINAALNAYNAQGLSAWGY